MFPNFFWLKMYVHFQLEEVGRLLPDTWEIGINPNSLVIEQLFFLIFRNVAVILTCMGKLIEQLTKHSHNITQVSFWGVGWICVWAQGLVVRKSLKLIQD